MNAFFLHDNINHISIFSSAYCEPLPLDGYIFGADFDLEWTRSQFTAKWYDFVLSDADNLARVDDVALNPSFVYPLGGSLAPSICCRIGTHVGFVNILIIRHILFWIRLAW